MKKQHYILVRLKTVCPRTETIGQSFGIVKARFAAGVHNSLPEQCIVEMQAEPTGSSGEGTAATKQSYFDDEPWFKTGQCLVYYRG